MRYSNENENRVQHELLKLDSRGHVLISPERRTDLLEEFDRSGMTGAGFARHYGIKYTTFNSQGQVNNQVQYFQFHPSVLKDMVFKKVFL